MEHAFYLCQSSYHSLGIISDLCVTCLARPLLLFEFLALDKERRGNLQYLWGRLRRNNQ